jgi:hypothetical protein
MLTTAERVSPAAAVTAREYGSSAGESSVCMRGRAI